MKRHIIWCFTVILGDSWFFKKTVLEVFVLGICVLVLKYVFCKAIINDPDVLKFPSKRFLNYFVSIQSVFLPTSVS